MRAIIAPMLPADTLAGLGDGDGKHTLWERVVQARLVADETIVEAVAERSRLPVADLQQSTEAARDALPEVLARRYGVLPLLHNEHRLEVATSNPFDLGAEQALAFATGLEIRMAIASPLRISERIDELYRGMAHGRSVTDLLEGMGDMEVTELVDGDDADDHMDEAGSQPIIKLVNVLLTDGITSRASDIHIESGEQSVLVRYRIDGVLRHAMTIPRKAGMPLISRIKIMSGLDIADRLRPQDGRARIAVGGDPTDLRISTLPATHGEKVVIRVLSSRTTTLSLDALGLYPDEQVTIRSILENKEGIFLVTGPTGSGKTTTLYSCIRSIQGEGINIVTVEDPVEYRLGQNIVQVQTNEKQGLTFAAALRSILRQDPDVVLVGEIRDMETAQIAVQASLTGHLVLSTLHTNDAPSTVTRLVDMGMEPFKIGAALRGILAQRLMRRLCPACRTPMSPEEVPLRLQPHLPVGAPLWKAVGCPQCTQTGYRGRFSIVEILVMNPELERLVGNNVTSDRIGEAARAAGMVTLFECGLRHVLDGHSTTEELLRVTDPPSERSGQPREAAAPVSPPVTTPMTVPVSPAAPVAVPSPGALLDDLELLDDPGSGLVTDAAEAKATILLVEDEDTLRRVMRDLLEQEGFAICEARDGAEALEQVDRFNPDLMILDLNLPNVDGYTVLTQLRSHARTRDLPVLVLSARGDEDNEVRVLRLGATDFLTKPFRPRALAARLDAILSRSRGLG